MISQAMKPGPHMTYAPSSPHAPLGIENEEFGGEGCSGLWRHAQCLCDGKPVARGHIAPRLSLQGRAFGIAMLGLRGHHEGTRTIRSLG